MYWAGGESLSFCISLCSVSVTLYVFLYKSLFLYFLSLSQEPLASLCFSLNPYEWDILWWVSPSPCLIFSL